MSFSFLSKFDPKEFYEIAKDLPNSLELNVESESQNNLNDILMENSSSHNQTLLLSNANQNIQITGTHILVPEDSLSQMIGFQLNSNNQIEENTIIDFDAISHMLPPIVDYMPPVSSLPNQEFQGVYNFKTIIASSEEKAKKSIAWTYSKQLNKLYCLPGVKCPIGISVSSIPPVGTIIRAQAVYSKSEHMPEIITRCENHKKNKEFENENNLNEKIVSHFIRCAHHKAIYEENEQTFRQSVLIPFERPQLGSNDTTILYQFMCYSSCVGGQNKPVRVVLTLELNGEVLGCSNFEVKICACPGRDRSTEEKKALVQKNADNKKLNDGKKTEIKIDQPETKPIKDENPQVKMNAIKIKSITRFNEEAVDSDNEIFTIKVRGRKNYEILKSLNEALEIKEMYPTLKRVNSNDLTRLEAKSVSNGLANNDHKPKSILKQVINNNMNKQGLLPNPSIPPFSKHSNVVFSSPTRSSSNHSYNEQILSLEHFLEYYDMSAYYNLLVSKGIKNLEILINANRKKINSLQISKSDTLKLWNHIQEFKSKNNLIVKKNNEEFEEKYDDDVNKHKANNAEPISTRSKRARLDEVSAISPDDLKGLSNAKISFNTKNSNLIQISNYQISFNKTV